MARGGIKRRLADASTAEPVSEVREDVNATPVAQRGGIKRRVSQAAQSSSSGGPCASDLPLNNSLKRDWALGALSSKKVQEYAWGGGDGPRIPERWAYGESGQ